LRAVAPYGDNAADPREDLVMTAFGGLDVIAPGDDAEAEAAGEWVCHT